jgi:hypothetical protein
VIEDCLGNLQVRETRMQEPEWATQVLAHYLPPVCAWRNRWGEEITLEQWTEFLLSRDVNQFSCGGTHLLHSLALLLQVQQQQQIMSVEVHRRLKRVCFEFSRMLEETQHSDGAWRADWTPQSRLSDSDFQTVEVHMTGHVLEAQLYLPEDLRIAGSCAALGLKFLARAMRLVSDEAINQGYCPYSHAGRVLLCCASRAVIPQTSGGL